MTEQQWLASTDPAAMYNFVRDRVTERQGRFIDNALYKYYDCNFPAAIGSTGGSVVAGLCDILREIIGNPFRPMIWRQEGDFALEGVFLDPAWLTWNNATIPNLIRSMMEEECDECQIIHGEHSRYVNFGPDSCWEKCSCNNGYVPRAEPQWKMMPLIADALESAGCMEAAILDHLRGAEPCPHCPDEPDYPLDHSVDCTCGHKDCPGVYLARCEHCNGTGKRPVRHYVGCWAIELLTGGVQ